MGEWVVVGRVAKAHGIRGEVAVEVLSDVPDRLAVGTEVLVGGRPAEVATARPHQGRLLIRFAHVHDRTAAELLRGASVEAAPVTTDDLDVFLIAELVGARVEGPDGADLGTVRTLIELPAVAGYDLLEVERADGSTWLLPDADELVEARDEGGVVVLVVRGDVDGLLDVAGSSAGASGIGPAGDADGPTP
jgi:16S rRNA processing protein RimM